MIDCKCLCSQLEGARTVSDCSEANLSFSDRIDEAIVTIDPTVFEFEFNFDFDLSLERPNHWNVAWVVVVIGFEL